ncbi:uncharacterized protein LOC144756188 isoform X2 [Lissotriton helveticus]
MLRLSAGMQKTASSMGLHLKMTVAGFLLLSGRAMARVTFRSFGLIDLNNRLNGLALLQEVCTILEHGIPLSGVQLHIQQSRASLDCRSRKPLGSDVPPPS